MTKTAEGFRVQAYQVFDQHIGAGLLSLTLPPAHVTSQVKLLDLPAFPNPLEVFEVEADFPGATCFVIFRQSTIDSASFSSQVELHRDREETLFLTDYLASRNDHRRDLLRFKINEYSLEAGIGRIVGVVVAVLNDELRPLLEGRMWLTAPFDWGGYK